jgi:hypothetical protein
MDLIGNAFKPKGGESRNSFEIRRGGFVAKIEALSRSRHFRA